MTCRFTNIRDGNTHYKNECARAGIPFAKEINVIKLNQLIELVERLPSKGASTAEFSANSAKKQLHLENPSRPAVAVVPLTAELAQATSALTAAKIDIEKLQARVGSLEANPSAPAKPAPPTEALKQCAKAAFGDGFLNQMAKVTSGEAELRDRICRAFHLQGLVVPNLDLSAHRKEFGVVEPRGMQRIETARMQENINNTLAKLK